MKIAIMRHGPAEEGALGQHDADRALTSDGRARVRAAAATLVAEGEAPLFVISSPLVRAVQTAEIVAAHCEVLGRGGQITIARGISPGGNVLDVITTLRAERRKRVLLVGHEPSVTTVIGELFGRYLPRGFSKAMAIGLSLHDDGPQWGTKFRFLLDPKTSRFEREPERVFG